MEVLVCLSYKMHFTIKIYGFILCIGGWFIASSQTHHFLNYSFENIEDEIPVLTKQLRFAKDSSSLNYKLGQCFYELNMDDKAHQYFSEAKKQFASQENPYQYDCDYYLHKTLTGDEGNVIDTTYAYLKNFQKHAFQENNAAEIALAQLEWAKIHLVDILQHREATKSLEFIDKAEKNIQNSDSLSLYYECSILRAIAYQLKGDFQRAQENYQESLRLAKNNKDNFQLFLVNNNMGRLMFENEDYPMALHYYTAAENIPLVKNKKQSFRLLYNNLKNYYKHTKNDNKYILYTQKLDSLEKELNYMGQLFNVSHAELASHQENSSHLHQLKQSFNRNRIVYGIIIFMVFLIAMYSFVRWLKADKSKKELEQSHEKKIKTLQIKHKQTLQKLDNMKELVIKDHIILKNKAKVYLDELYYIQSQDHYLQLFEKEGKNFIRGSIKQILDELPPNFKQSHRSFIVNTNYIQRISATHIFLETGAEIPLSRTYKKNFKNLS